MSPLSRSAVSVFAFSFGSATLLRVIADPAIGQIPYAHITLSIGVFALSVHLALRHAVGPINDGVVARVMMLGRDRRAFVLRAGLLGTMIYVATSILPAVAASGQVDWTLAPMALVLLVLHLAIASALHWEAVNPGKAFDQLRNAQGAYRGSAAASRASASIPAQSPLTILPFGATQLPPTQTVLGSPR